MNIPLEDCIIKERPLFNEGHTYDNTFRRLCHLLRHFALLSDKTYNEAWKSIDMGWRKGREGNVCINCINIKWFLHALKFSSHRRGFAVSFMNGTASSSSARITITVSITGKFASSPHQPCNEKSLRFFIEECIKTLFIIFPIIFYINLSSRWKNRTFPYFC